MARVYVRIESAATPGKAATPAEEAACLAVSQRIAKALGVDQEPGTRPRRGQGASLRGVTLRLDVEG